MPSLTNNPSQPTSQNRNTRQIQEVAERNGQTSQNGEEAPTPQVNNVPNGHRSGHPIQEDERDPQVTNINNGQRLADISVEFLRLNAFINDILHKTTPEPSFSQDGSFNLIYPNPVPQDCVDVIWKEAEALLGGQITFPENKIINATPGFAKHRRISLDCALKNLNYSHKIKNFSEYLMNQCKFLLANGHGIEYFPTINGLPHGEYEQGQEQEHVVEYIEQYSQEYMDHIMAIQDFVPIPQFAGQQMNPIADNFSQQFSMPMPPFSPPPAPGFMYPPQMHPIPGQFGPAPLPMFMPQGMAPVPDFWHGFQYQFPCPYQFIPGVMAVAPPGPGFFMQQEFYQMQQSGFVIPQPNGPHQFEPMQMVNGEANGIVNGAYIYHDQWQYVSCTFCGTSGHAEQECTTINGDGQNDHSGYAELTE